MISVSPEIMIPLVMNANELRQMKDILSAKIKEIESELNTEFTYTMGTMIELPSAALNSESIALEADFLFLWNK
jgi:pyruvate,orthophosphate dikinase